MARLSKNNDFSDIIQAAQVWMRECLVKDGSIFSDSSLWRSENVAILKHAFTENPDEGTDDFITKLKRQVQGLSPEAPRLMAEMMWALLLFPSNIKPATKRQQIVELWSLGGSELAVTHSFLRDDILSGIGSGGQGFNNHRWRELAYLLDFVLEFKKLQPSNRERTLANYQDYMAWIGNVPDHGPRQFIQMFRFVAFPVLVERMSTNNDRRHVLHGFKVASKKELERWTDKELDEALLSLRKKLEEGNPGIILDFYEEPLVSQWARESDDRKVVTRSFEADALPHLEKDFRNANFFCEQAFLTRFTAALLSKRFVILTGLAGSGKTKLAQAFCRWISQSEMQARDPFKPGRQIPADRVTYLVQKADRLAVEFWNEEDQKKPLKVVLPRELIQEWADYIRTHGLTKETSNREIRDAVGAKTKFSGQLNSFESNLKAAAFALLDAQGNSSCYRCYEVVAVGADWTSTEHVLGYPDGLDKSRYVRTRTLDLILRAEAQPDLPHFLILDEMNLSHVERYFADLLSAFESGEPVHLHSDKDEAGFPSTRDGVPGEVSLPRNLFIIGTVNVDETTYMFSPKVLDRANALEFRVSAPDLKKFLKRPEGIDFRKLDGAGARFAKEFVTLANHGQELPEEERRQLEAELLLFFEALQSVNAEFGFRVAKEGAAFVHSHRLISGESWEFKNAMDALILQKLLPKLHGARNTLEPVLWTLATLCFSTRIWDFDEAVQEFNFVKDLRLQAAKAMRMEDDSFDPLGLKTDGQPAYTPENAYYPLSFEKIVRMLARLRANGFTSFAEA